MQNQLIASDTLTIFHTKQRVHPLQPSTAGGGLQTVSQFDLRKIDFFAPIPNAPTNQR
jgi:hypothetical protein